MITRGQIKKIKVLQRAAGLDDDLYREMLWGVARVKSCKELKGPKVQLVIKHLEKCLGKEGKRGKGEKDRPQNPEPRTRNPEPAPQSYRGAVVRNPPPLGAGEPGGAGVGAGVGPGPPGPEDLSLGPVQGRGPGVADPAPGAAGH